jgi:uncharacterized protein with NRDE domain
MRPKTINSLIEESEQKIMCLLFIAMQRYRNVPLVVCFNRDEDLKRPALPADFWFDQPDILAGRDLLKGGTWGGITRSGRMAFITFVRRRESPKGTPRPRGEIVPAFLTGKMDPSEYLQALEAQRFEYMGYNIVCGDRDRLFHYSNVSGRVTPLESGVHGISNALLNTPWPKVVKGVARIEQLSEAQVVDQKPLFDVIMDQERADRSQVPRDTGMSEEKEWYRSSLFVNTPGYGTRTSTIVLFHGDGSIQFTERTHFPVSSEVEFRI